MTNALHLHCALALNSDGLVPEWIQLLPAGSFQGRDGRAWINSDPDRVISEFVKLAMPLRVDYEHASESDVAKEAPASGWISRLENRSGEIWGRVEWTARAAQMIGAQEYRYLSPVFYFDEARNVIALSSVGLTNAPNLYMTALNKSGSLFLKSEQLEKTKMDKTLRLALCKALGLADEASDSAILSGVDALKNNYQTALNKAETPDAEKFVPRADYDMVKNSLEVAQNSLAQRDLKAAEATVDQAIKEGKIAPASKDYHLAACKAEGGLERFSAMVAAAPKLTGGDSLKKDPDDKGDLALNRDQEKILSGLGVSLDDEKVIADLKATGAL